MNVNFRHFWPFFVYFISLSADAVSVKVQVKDPTDQVLENMVVYLEPLDGQQLSKTEKSIDIDQENKAFTPYISVIQTGNQVHFNNQDDITHHIYSVTGSHKFSITIRAGEKMLKPDFTQTGEIAMGCNIHDWMSGYLLVLDTPYFDKTNASGQAMMEVNEGGKYQLTVWHPQMSEPDNRLSTIITLPGNTLIQLKLNQEMEALPQQKSDDDFFFLSEY